MPYELADLIARRREVTFDFYGIEFKAEYYVTKMTESVMTNLVRLMRETEKAQERTTALSPDLESSASDERFEAAVASVEREAKTLKLKIDRLVCELLYSWDLLEGGVPIPFTPEGMVKVPSEFEGAVIRAVVEDARGLGETSRNGKASITRLPTTSSRRARRAASRQSQTG